MSSRTASCSCGRLSVACEGEPVRISVCHCTACQRRTGSAFGVQARFPRAKVKIEGASTTYTRLADSGNAIPFHFCPTCGSTVYYEVTIDAERFVAVAVGAFADTDFPEPRFSVYEARQHKWVKLGTKEPVDHVE